VAKIERAVEEQDSEGRGKSFRFDRLKGLGVLAGGQDRTRNVLKR